MEYLKPFRQQSGSVHFHCKQETTETSCVGRQCITIDIGTYTTETSCVGRQCITIDIGTETSCVGRL